MAHMPAGAPPRVIFSRHSQVAPPRVHFSENASTGELSGQRTQEFAPGGGGSERGGVINHTSLSVCAGPIASVSRANCKETYKERGAPSLAWYGRGGPEGSKTIPHTGGNAVYDFSQRVILTTAPHSHPLQHAASTDHIYETILGHVPVSTTLLQRQFSEPMMKGMKSVSRATTKASPAPSTSASQISDPGTDGAVSGDGGRYRSRRPAATKVVHVNPKTLPASSRRQGRGVNGFFPPVKLRENSLFAEAKRKRLDMRTPPFILELAPEEAALWAGELKLATGLRAPSAKSSVTRSDPASSQGRHYALSMTPPVYPHVASDTPCDDLTSMPRPRMMVSRGELPWVYRQKVKRSMNELSKIMASRPPQSMESGSSMTYRYGH